MYAIIEFAGGQFKVSPGVNFTAQYSGLSQSQKITVEKVLFTVDDSSVAIGQPYLSDTKVFLTVQQQKLGKKVKVIRFKAKSRYARRSGIRQMETIFSVDRIERKR